MDFKEKERTTVVIGAGPAGLAAAHRLSGRGAACLVLEKDGQPGGLSKTVCRDGFRADLGGHRYYTRNAEVLAWWKGLLKDDFLSVERRSRIYYRDGYYDYPLSLPDILSHLGPAESAAIVLSWLKGRFSRVPVNDFEQWTSRNFGRRLYSMFFDGYTRKVWGIPGSMISADMAGERIRRLSLSTILASAVPGCSTNAKSLIREFLYPRLGCGMMYEAAAREIAAMGGRLRLDSEVTGLRHDGGRILSVRYRDKDGQPHEAEASHVCSSMPLTSLVGLLDAGPEVLAAARRLKYRSLMIVCCVIERDAVSPDNWIYVNDPGLGTARIQNFGNWSRQMLPDASRSCLGMEYFCDREDAAWRSSDGVLGSRAADELERLGLCAACEVSQTFVLRVPDAYPLYGLGYARDRQVLKDFVSRFTNLHCMGRSGMFHYNSMDHSVLTGLRAADNCLGASCDLWSVEPEGGRYA